MPFLATLHGLVSPRQPSLLNSLASVQLSNLRHCWRCTHTSGPARYWSIKLQLAGGSKRLPDHLVHVIITIGGEAPDEDHLRLCRGQGFIALVQRLVLRPWNGIIRIAVRARKIGRASCRERVCQYV